MPPSAVAVLQDTPGGRFGCHTGFRCLLGSTHQGGSAHLLVQPAYPVLQPLGLMSYAFGPFFNKKRIITFPDLVSLQNG